MLRELLDTIQIYKLAVTYYVLDGSSWETSFYLATYLVKGWSR